MARASKTCAQPLGGGRLCPKLRPCAAHPPRPSWGGRGRPSWRARGYDAEYNRNRAVVMREEAVCALCGGPGLENDEADHKLPLSEGGTNDRGNLQRVHRRCNAAKNARRMAARTA